MNLPQLQRLWPFLIRIDPWLGVLWLGLAALTVTLVILSRTKWGQSKPIRKCLVLSILTHVLLAAYATTVNIVTSLPERTSETAMNVTIYEGLPREPEPTGSPAKPLEAWESFHHDRPVQPPAVELARADVVETVEMAPTLRPDPPTDTPTDALHRLPLDPLPRPQPEPLPEAPSPVPTSSDVAAAGIVVPQARRPRASSPSLPSRAKIEHAPPEPDSPAKRAPNRRPGTPSTLLERPLPSPQLAEPAVSPQPQPALAAAADVLTAPGHGRPVHWAEETESTVSGTTSGGELHPAAIISDTGPGAELARRADLSPSELVEVGSAQPPAVEVGAVLLPAGRRMESNREIPRIYRLRVAPDRSKIALRHGATSESEEAVRAALQWLADNQAADGRWAVGLHEGGRERYILGRDRDGAGGQADTGITGLALLAMLASGHTHQDGIYRDNVRRGLEFLLRGQATDGGLSGQAGTYASMYCHAMATFALSEAYGMTGDHRLEGAVRSAIGYTISAQNHSSGGWRYNPGDDGDTSLLGWQLMALKSGELAGIPISEHTRQGALRYLNAASSGQHGGLAAYRPVERPSRPMTAEALACRQFLGTGPHAAAAREAAQYLLDELPGEGEKNFYYWYYGTLAMYSLQGDQWQRWNAALQTVLLRTQRKSGPATGSWDPDTVWGGYGGRVYTTAMATLSLEVYYRYLPLFVEAASLDRRWR